MRRGGRGRRKDATSTGRRKSRNGLITGRRLAGFAATHDMKILNATTADWLAPASPVTIVRSAYHPPVLGLAILLTGKGKLLDLEKPTQFFRCLEIPFRNEQAILGGATECVGGLLLLLGLALRLISIPLMILLTVAYLTGSVK